MVLPVYPRVTPPDMAGTANGRLEPDQLARVQMAGMDVSCHPAYARALRAVQFDLDKATGAKLCHVGGYRSYPAQVSLFTQRYKRTSPGEPTWGTRDKYWDGSWWYHYRDAVAATPGFSDHGWGLAIDAAYWNGTKPIGIRSDARAWSWIKANLTNYGLCWAWDEEDEEPWHWHLFRIGAPAVVAYEKGQNPPPIVLPPTLPPFDPANRAYSLWPLNPNKPVLQVGSEGDAVRYLQGILKNEVARFASWFHAFKQGDSVARQLYLEAAGRDCAALAIDGRYGQVTEQAVLYVQHAFTNTTYGGRTVGTLTPDGKIGNQQMWPFLDSLADGEWV